MNITKVSLVMELAQYKAAYLHPARSFRSFSFQDGNVKCFQSEPRPVLGLPEGARVLEDDSGSKGFATKKLTEVRY